MKTKSQANHVTACLKANRQTERNRFRLQSLLQCHLSELTDYQNIPVKTIEKIFIVVVKGIKPGKIFAILI